MAENTGENILNHGKETPIKSYCSNCTGSGSRLKAGDKIKWVIDRSELVMKKA